MAQGDLKGIFKESVKGSDCVLRAGGSDVVEIAVSLCTTGRAEYNIPRLNMFPQHAWLMYRPAELQLHCPLAHNP